CVIRLDVGGMRWITKLFHHRFGLRNGFELGATCIEKQRAYSSEDLEFGLLASNLVREGGSDVLDFVALDQRENFIDGHPGYLVHGLGAVRIATCHTRVQCSPSFVSMRFSA